jgi:hypothetical protein
VRSVVGVKTHYKTLSYRMIRVKIRPRAPEVRKEVWTVQKCTVKVQLAI